MAKLSDVPVVLRRVGPFRFVRKLWFEIGDDNLFVWASALAYSWLFALFPFLLVLLSLIPMLPQNWRLEARQQMNLVILQLPREAQVTVRQYIDPKLNQYLFEAPQTIKGIWSIGLLVTLWAASGGVSMTMSALDRCYDVERARPFYKQKPLAVLLTMAVATMVVLVVILIPIGTVVTNYITTRTERLLVQTGMTEAPSAEQKPAEVSATAPTTAATTQGVAGKMVRRPGTFAAGIVIWQIARFTLGGLLLFFIVALFYYFGPNVKQPFRIFSPGAVFTVAMWVALGGLFRIYVDTFGKYGQTYGAVGGVIILLFFFYLDALLLLVGAEMNAELDCALREAAHEREKPPPQRETQETQPVKETP